MTRQDLLKYITKTHGDALAQVGMMPIDTPESMFYVINDALMMTTDKERKAEADRCVAVLLVDRRDALGITESETDSPPAVEDEIEDVSNFRSE